MGINSAGSSERRLSWTENKTAEPSICLYRFGPDLSAKDYEQAERRLESLCSPEVAQLSLEGDPAGSLFGL